MRGAPAGEECMRQRRAAVGWVKNTGEFVFTAGMEWTMTWEVKISEFNVERSILF